MGITVGKDVDFKCSYDCHQSGCPGHKIRLEFSRTSDVLCFYLDNYPILWADDAKWEAMKKAAELCE